MLFEGYFRKKASGIEKAAIALPQAYQLALGIGVGGLAGIGSYHLIGNLDKKNKDQTKLPRALMSALIGAGVGAGAVYAGNTYFHNRARDFVRKKHGKWGPLMPKAELDAIVDSPIFTNKKFWGLPIEKEPILGLGHN